MPEEEFIKALDFAQDQVAQARSTRRRNSPPRPESQASGHALRRSRRASRNRLPAWPATASKPRSTPQAKSPAEGRRKPSRTKSSAAIRGVPGGHEVRDQPGLRLPPEESLPRQHPRQEGPLRRPRSRRDSPAQRGDGLLPRAMAAPSSSAARPRPSASPRSRPADEAQELDSYTGGETSKRFILHYNFPPFSVGETGRIRRPGPARDRPRRARRAVASSR